MKSTKNANLSSYYINTKRSFARNRFYTFHNKTSTKRELFKNHPYKRYTHVGANRRRVYKRDPIKSNLFIKSQLFNELFLKVSSNLLLNLVIPTRSEQSHQVLCNLNIIEGVVARARIYHWF